jgi:hypothetical protein
VPATKKKRQRMSMNARTANPKFAFESFSAHGQIRRNHAMKQCHAKWLGNKKKEQPARFEPATASLGLRRSHHLGYARLLSRKQPQRYLIGAKQKN